MVRGIFGGLLAAVGAYVVSLGQRVVTAAIMVVLLTAGLAAFFGVLFGVIGVYVVLGEPPGLAAAAGILGFGGGFVVASIVVIKLVRWGARHVRASAETPPSEAKPAARTRTEVMTMVASLDRHLAPPDQAAARDADAPDHTPRT
jgi:hypothetical protein